MHCTACFSWGHISWHRPCKPRGQKFQSACIYVRKHTCMHACMVWLMWGVRSTHGRKWRGWAQPSVPFMHLIFHACKCHASCIAWLHACCCSLHHARTYMFFWLFFFDCNWGNGSISSVRGHWLHACVYLHTCMHGIESMHVRGCFSWCRWPVSGL